MGDDQRLKAIAVLWVMTGLSFILVPLRLYTRIYLLRGLGLDDHVFNLGWVFMLLHTIFYTVADTIPSDDPRAMYMGMIGQTFAILGLAIANISLGIFLLRIVVKAWHRLSIYIATVSVSLVSVLMVVVFWVQRSPTESIYDPTVAGRTLIPVRPFSTLLGSWCTVVDFFFAIIPWIFIWELNMRFKEKLTITMSFSLGFIAGICGIIRTVELSKLSETNYTEGTVTLIIWSAIELAVTLICVGIPTVRPLYLKIVHRSNSKYTPDYNKETDNGENLPRFEMPMRKFNHMRYHDGSLDGDVTDASIENQYPDCIQIHHEVKVEAH
ncbi:uncharacterized protein ATNIH1004_005229 [Aspergillus tanneri]|uniref:Rhodopsin domain-containing protein n=1 Tax=Aspergillus tanneri TaxID=1220188 RepID=A0A5M9MR07_9EURO|nr:uncharacterized protein ATNIH1004_005229 [Aspergillus tanneri]KAA8649328.1 hypothetical protein ATNIH1004_005229 [Aspergillus tanneri]